MRRFSSGRWLIVLAIITLAGSIGVTGSLLSPSPASALDPVAPPPVTAKAVYVVDATLDVVLYELNPDERRPPASLTKIATALLVAQLAPDTSQVVTVDPADVLDVSDGQSMMALLPGDQLTIEQLLYGLMLNSGNDAASTLSRFLGQQLLDAEGASGDPKARFIQEMNALAASIGLQNTHFVNAEGLYADDHYSTARDLATMADLLLQNELLAKIVSTSEITVTSLLGNSYTLQNTNRLLSEQGYTGMKTGTLPESGACLVAAKTGSAGTSIVTVVLGSEIAFSEDGIQDPETDQRFDDARTIFAAAESDYEWIAPSSDSTLPGLDEELAVWEVELEDADPMVVREGQLETLRYVLRLGPPVAPNQQAGEVLLYDGAALIETRPVFQLDQAA